MSNCTNHSVIWLWYNDQPSCRLASRLADDLLHLRHSKPVGSLFVPCGIAGYGQESHSRVQRQQIPHQIYKDNNGVEHVRVRTVGQCHLL